ncbi:MULTISPECIES: OmpA family protein [Pseudoalteromonas]|uniref:OmpA family protein n=1 Tax=Pseudoalteromonas maricaloris TaxID=184924 RepID=A0A8I2HBL7_9GAMM|nr:MULTISPECIES: OmpA family protein [Pseudoalteromonas]KID38524.1 hypothetical protein QT15_03375 [Pseudoalteromonas flavipulchra NCIMB 2033 = ATCC BAA-314]MBD0783229.1 OmpA family protein [Pseudoalteromonas flavipulchra]MBE0371877.1 hypothetical protein [Pseudoalteromonas flavipulchra NCIMB 2033 = ATCC BAA-314]NLR22560.1 OmpA family protein [Pseudoalteromonas maricaloris]RZG14793.1 hypothetical protein EXT47_12865 [Pseudoalteromonas sp. CO342X]
MLFENTELESDNEMGPGTDLVLSLLSVIITILAVVGMSYSVTDIEPEQAVNCQGGNCEPSVTIESLQLDLKDAQLEITKLTMQIENLRASPKKQPSIVYGDVLELYESELAVFERNQARIRQEDLPTLREQLKPLYEKVRMSNANVIRIHGYASPEPRRAGLDHNLDSNMDLSVERGLTILHAMSRLGIPYKCMVVEGYGRNRSRFLSSFLSQRNITIHEWDSMYLQGFDQSILPSQRGRLLSELEALYQLDRRVDLVAAIEAASPCSSEELISHFKQVIKRPILSEQG